MGEQQERRVVDVGGQFGDGAARLTFGFQFDLTRTPAPAAVFDSPPREATLTDSPLLDAINLQKIAGNPLTQDEIDMFEMFEREGWSHARRRQHIGDLTRMRARATDVTSATEQEPKKSE